jgi:hypothetical protein
MQFLYQKVGHMWLFLALLTGVIFTTGRSYPIKQVTKPEIACKSLARSKLNDECKMDLPIIKNSDYNLFHNNRKYTSIYSDVWGGSYDNGWDINYGGAPSVDIASSEWTPVYAIGRGKVIFAWVLKWYWNSVTIEHTIGKWKKAKKIWSSYSHLSKIKVKTWEEIKEWVEIGEIGKTGFSIGMFGNHLDFAITTKKQKSYPYAYWDCKKWYMDAVQKWSCRQLLAENTVDPIVFLELNGDINKAMKLAKVTVDAWKVKQELLAKTNKDTAPTKAINLAKLAVIDQKIINQKIYKVIEDNLTIEIVDLYKKNNEHLGLEKKAYVTVVIKDKNGDPYTWFLGKKLVFTSANKKVGLAWESIGYVVDGEQTVILYGNQKWDDTISVKRWDTTLGVHKTKVS